MAANFLASNIRALREHLGLNQAAFAARFGSKQFQVSKWEAGQEPAGRTLADLASAAGVAVGDFIDKEWSAFDKRGASPGKSRAGRASAPDDVVEIVSLDLSLSMGPGTLIEDFVEAEPVKMDLGLVQSITRTPSDRLRLVKGIGESMEPTLRTGDRVMVDINDRALSRIDGIYWIDVFGGHAIKRLRPVKGGRIRVSSDNALVAPEEYDASDVRIEGRVIWFAREL